MTNDTNPPVLDDAPAPDDGRARLVSLREFLTSTDDIVRRHVEAGSPEFASVAEFDAWLRAECDVVTPPPLAGALLDILRFYARERAESAGRTLVAAAGRTPVTPTPSV